MYMTNTFLFLKTLRLEAGTRAITVTPHAARLLRRRRIAAQPAAVTLGTTAADLSRTRVILAGRRDITITGSAALTRQLLLTCQPAEISLGTSEAILQRTRMAGFIKTEITIEPQPARLLRNLVLKALPATVELTPNSASFLKVQGSIEAQPQAISIQGQSADLRATRLLISAPAAVVVTPRPAQLLRSYPLSAQPVGLVALPRPAILRLSRVLKAVKQDIALSAKSTNLTVRDNYFAQVAALLHFDGANGATTFADSSAVAATFARTGAPTISTAQSKFGGASGLFNGSGQFITAPANAAYAIGTGDFTIECFCRFNTVANSDTFAHTVSDGGLAFFRTTTRLGLARFWVANDLVANWSPAINTWYHIAASRQSGTARLFVDGVQIGSGTVTTSYIQGGFCVGGGKSSFAADTIDGYIDELRLTVGLARYTGNFTVPIAPFQNQ